MKRGEVWWASLTEPVGSGPGYRRPVLIVQSDSFNDSSIKTVIVAAITTSLRVADAPGNVRLTRRKVKLKRDSVINVSQLLAVDKSVLKERVGRLALDVMQEVDAGLRSVLSL